MNQLISAALSRFRYSLSASGGAALVGFSALAAYVAGSMGAALAEVRDAVFGKDAATLKAFGDSIVRGGAVANPFPSLFATAMGWAVTNSGVDGAQSHDVAVPLYAAAIGENENVIVAVGVSNMRLAAGSAAKKKYFRQSHAALVAFAAIPASRKVMATDPRITYAGTWANNNTYGATINKYSTTVNSTASFEASGSVIYIGVTVTETAVGKVKVTVDGVDKGIYACAAPGITTPLGQAFGPRLIRIPLAQGGRHKVVLTVVSPTVANNNVFLDWYAGSDDAGGPKVYVGNITYMTAAGYATYGGSDAETDEFNRIIAENCLMLAGDGMRVCMVDGNGVITPATELADGLHPTQQGYQDIADGYKAAALARKTARARELYRPVSLTANELAGYVGYPGEPVYIEDTGVFMTNDGVTAGTPGSVYAPALANGWDHAYATANGLSPVRYYRDSAGVVHIEGCISNGAIGEGAPPFNLRAGYRPIETKIFNVITNDVLGKVAVLANGDVKVIAGSATYVSLEGITFRAA